MNKVFASILTSSLLFATMFLSSACSELKKVDEMKDNTSEMNRTTKELRDKTGEMKDGLDKMSTTTEKMKNTTGDMNGGMTDLYESMRQGDTSGLRGQRFAQLQREPTLQGRVAEAGLYLMSFEFQVLRSSPLDRDPEHRQMLYHQAMLEFMLKLDNLAPKHYDVTPTANPTTDIDDRENKTSAFNAIAFTLHKTNRQQLADPVYGKPMSFYDLIIVALKMKPLIDSGDVVLPEGPHFIKEVLARPDRVRQLLQTRYNMFTFGLLGLTTELVDFAAPVQLLKLLMKIDIDLTEKTLGVARLQYIYEEIMKPAAITADDMLAVGIEPEFSTMTGIALKGMRIKFSSYDKETISINSVKAIARAEAMKTLWTRYERPRAPTANN